LSKLNSFALSRIMRKSTFLHDIGKWLIERFYNAATAKLLGIAYAMHGLGQALRDALRRTWRAFHTVAKVLLKGIKFAVRAIVKIVAKVVGIVGRFAWWSAKNLSKLIYRGFRWAFRKLSEWLSNIRFGKLLIRWKNGIKAFFHGIAAKLHKLAAKVTSVFSAVKAKMLSALDRSK